jgi:hypothetical protein
MSISGMFKEVDGSLSFARVQSFIHGLSGIGWVTSFMVHNHYIMPDIATISGISAFILGPYTVNKVSTMFGKDQG